MDDGEVFSLDRWHFDERWFIGKRLRGEKLEGQVRDGCTEFGARGAVPGVNFVERFERRGGCVFGDADQVEARVGDGSCFIGKADQGKSHARGPNFGVIGFRGFERWKREYYVADGAGADQEAAHDLFRLGAAHFESLWFFIGLTKGSGLADLPVFRIGQADAPAEGLLCFAQGRRGELSASYPVPNIARRSLDGVMTDGYGRGARFGVDEVEILELGVE
jgi:hypothetical protein